MKFKSPNFKDVDEAFSVVNKMVEDDNAAQSDRQLVANFYSGRETMTEDEAEQSNNGDVVNHLFGFNAIDKLRSQVSSIFSSNDAIWKVLVKHPELDVAAEQAISACLTQVLAKRLRRSRRLRPEWRVAAGNMILHGLDTMIFQDQMDWCPVSGLLYVPPDAKQSRDSLPYAFQAANISYDKLSGYVMASQNGATGWNKVAITEALKSLSPGEPYAPIIEQGLGDEKTSQHANEAALYPEQGFVSTRSTLPVWYLYEVDFTKPARPVSLKILARYTQHTTKMVDGVEKKVEMSKTSLLYENKDHFASNRHWIVPFFVDTEIGGESLWNAATGVGRLNYPRDIDTEEFFNIAMDGAKDQMRTKWKVVDGASREKIQRFFADRQDLIPEGLEMVKQETGGNYQHAFNIIALLRQLSAADAAAPNQNVAGSDSQDLEIQVAERQAGSANILANRMSDIYDSLDDLGSEIVRRFMSSPIGTENPGYPDVALFRSEAEAKGYPAALLRKLAEVEAGEMKWIEVKTIRSVGDGSRADEVGGVQALMGSLGAFSPEGQEMIKRRFALTVTRDPDFAKELVPFESKPDPDQLSRARNENTAAMSRGIIGFVPELNNDDVHMIHAPEHDQEIDAANRRAEAGGGMDEVVFAGVKAVAQHQSSHISQMEGDPAQSEIANALKQKLTKQMGTAQGLADAHAKNKQNEEISPTDQIKLQQNERKINLSERSQASIEQDREVRNQLDVRELAGQEAKMINDAAAKSAALVQPPQQS